VSPNTQKAAEDFMRRS